MKEWGGLIFFALIFAIPITTIITDYFKRKLQSDERIRAIERGVPLPPDPITSHPWDRHRNKDAWEKVADLRVGALICMATGVGMAILFVGLAWSLPEFPLGVVGAAAIPFLIGAVLFYEYSARARELGPRPTPPVSAPQQPMGGA